MGQLTQFLQSCSMKIPPAPMPTSQTDEDLIRLERDIRQLKIEFDQYFGGGRKRPPNDIEWRIEQLIKRYGDRAAEMNYGQRFRYGNLSQTYAKYRGQQLEFVVSVENGKARLKARVKS